MQFAESGVCRSRAHCATCRDLAGGRAWRERQSARFALPGGEIDFECEVVPWGGGERLLVAAGGGTAAEPVALVAVDYEQWPAWAKGLALRRTDADVGVGDTVARMAGEAGRTFKEMYHAVTGGDCGCDGRHVRWNAMYPYSVIRGAEKDGSKVV